MYIYLITQLISCFMFGWIAVVVARLLVDIGLCGNSKQSLLYTTFWNNMILKVIDITYDGMTSASGVWSVFLQSCLVTNTNCDCEM